MSRALGEELIGRLDRERDLGEMPVERCILYRSILGSGAARYEERSCAMLGGAG